MPVFKMRNSDGWYYAVASFDEMITTYQLTEDAVAELLAMGLRHDDEFSYEELARYRELGWAYTGGSGPGYLSRPPERIIVPERFATAVGSSGERTALARSRAFEVWGVGKLAAMSWDHSALIVDFVPTRGEKGYFRYPSNHLEFKTTEGSWEPRIDGLRAYHSGMGGYVEVGRQQPEWAASGSRIEGEVRDEDLPRGPGPYVKSLENPRWGIGRVLTGFGYEKIQVDFGVQGVKRFPNPCEDLRMLSQNRQWIPIPPQPRVKGRRFLPI